MGQQGQCDMLTASNPADAHKLVSMAMRYWYAKQGRNARRPDQLWIKPQTSNNAFDNDNRGTKPRVFVIRNPMNIRIRAKVVQKYTIVNITNRPIMIRRIRAKAKRHLETSLPTVAANPPLQIFKPTTAVIWTIADEQRLDETSNAASPAGINGAAIWAPQLGTQFTYTTQPQFIISAAVDNASSTGNFLNGLRAFHAQDQFQPWWHTMRYLMPWMAINPTLSNSAATIQPLVGSPTTINPVSAPQMGNSLGTTGSLIGTYWDTVYQPDVVDVSAGTGNLGQVGNLAWQPASFRNTTSSTPIPWSQTNQPPASGTFERSPDYREHAKGIIDRFFKRRSYKRWLKPGQRMFFSEKTMLRIRPMAQGIYGYTGGSTVDLQEPASQRWRAGGWLQDLQTASISPYGSDGLGFSAAIGSGAVPQLVNAAAPAVCIRPYEYPRAMYCKRTDPLGSPCTTALNTVVIRGGMSPSIPVAGPDWTQMIPATVLIHMATHWKTKMYEVRDKSAKKRPYNTWNDQGDATSIGITSNLRTAQPAWPTDGVLSTRTIA